MSRPDRIHDQRSALGVACGSTFFQFSFAVSLGRGEGFPIMPAVELVGPECG